MLARCNRSSRGRPSAMRSMPLRARAASRRARASWPSCGSPAIRIRIAVIPPSSPASSGLGRAGDEAEPLAGIDALAQRLPPGPVVEIPAHRRGEPAVEIVTGAPAEPALELAGVDGIAVVVAGAVGDEG